MSVNHRGQGSNAVHYFRRKNAADTTDDVAKKEVNSDLFEVYIESFPIVEWEEGLDNEGPSKGIRGKKNAEFNDSAHVLRFDPRTIASFLLLNLLWLNILSIHHEVADEAKTSQQSIHPDYICNSLIFRPNIVRIVLREKTTECCSGCLW